MAYTLEITDGAMAELDDLRAHDHRRVLETIDAQLKHEPGVPTRNRKCLGEGMTANFEYVPPLWELRVGEFRVFYEIADQATTVIIHAVRRKPSDRTTTEVLNEGD